MGYYETEFVVRLVVLDKTKIDCVTERSFYSAGKLDDCYGTGLCRMGWDGMGWDWMGHSGVE